MIANAHEGYTKPASECIYFTKNALSLQKGMHKTQSIDELNHRNYNQQHMLYLGRNA